MAKPATKKSPKSSVASKPKKAPAAKSSRAAPPKPAGAAKPSGTRKVAARAVVLAKKTRAARAPVISKDELRSQIEKLTAANVTLKTKGRETAKALKAAEARIAVLEHQISQTEAKAVIEDRPKKRVKAPRMAETSAPPAAEEEPHEDPEAIQ